MITCRLLRSCCRRHLPHRQTHTQTPHCRVAVIGSGPAGFYTTQHLLKSKQHKFHVDIFDRAPVPFGLVRYGVAPDHPEVKNCINTFEEIAGQENVQFYGNVTVGRDVSISELLAHYHIVLLAYGAGADKKLGIPGEGAPGCYKSSEFVGWFNGVPEHSQLDPDLASPVIPIIGHGNVALDCARILAAPLSHLEKTDISEHALQSLRHRKVREVQLYGRRGILQFQGTIKELREFTKLGNVGLRVESDDVGAVSAVVGDIPRPKKRLTELLLKHATSPTTGTNSNVSLKFGYSPLQITLDSTGAVSGLVLQRNTLSGDVLTPTLTPTEHTLHVPCRTVITSIGYNVVRLPGVPWCEDTNRIPERLSRVLEREAPVPGLYTSGWARRGSDGVMATTITDSANTALSILEDLGSAGMRDVGGVSGGVGALLQDRGVEFVTYEDWQAIDRIEKEKGMSQGKPREKIVNYNDILKKLK